MKLKLIREKVAIDTIKLAPKSMYSGLIGWGARQTLPRILRKTVYETFAQAVGADLDEVEYELAEYHSLSAFFSRGLKPGVREFPEQEETWIAPCDSLVAEFGALEERVLVAKGQSFSLKSLLASERLALSLLDGQFATFYLSPKDYHRVHAPIECELIGYEYVPGSLFPVGPFCVRNIDNIFSLNERLVLEFQCAEGLFVLVMVGAAGVGNLHLSDLSVETRHWREKQETQRVRLEEPLKFKRGQEIGAFDLGSTVVLCVPNAVSLSVVLGEKLQFGRAITASEKVSA